MHCGQKLAVRQLRQLFVSAGDSNELLDFVVIRREVGVAYRPVVTITIAAGSLEFVIRQPVGLATPHDRAAANLASSDPFKWFSTGSCIGIIDVIDEELMAVFVTCVTL